MGKWFGGKDCTRGGVLEGDLGEGVNHWFAIPGKKRRGVGDGKWEIRRIPLYFYLVHFIAALQKLSLY